jgi:hypothetical protein
MMFMDFAVLPNLLSPSSMVLPNNFSKLFTWRPGYPAHSATVEDKGGEERETLQSGQDRSDATLPPALGNLQ